VRVPRVEEVIGTRRNHLLASAAEEITHGGSSVRLRAPVGGAGGGGPSAECPRWVEGGDRRRRSDLGDRHHYTCGNHYAGEQASAETSAHGGEGEGSTTNQPEGHAGRYRFAIDS
jgi:hypothetical protein